MATYGENVGTAYVKILADGDNLDESIREQFDDVDWDQHGRKASQEWTDGFAEEQAKKPNQTKLRDAIAGPLKRGQWLSDEFFKSHNWKNFRSGMEKEYGSAGRLAVENLEREMFEGMDFTRLNARLENVVSDAVKARRKINQAHTEALAEDQRRTLEAFRNTIDTQETEYRLHIQNLKDADRQRVEQWQNDIDNAEAKYRVHINALIRQEQRREAAAAAAAKQQREDMEKHLAMLMEAHWLNRQHDLRRKKSLDDIRTSFQLLNRETRALAEGMKGAYSKDKLLQLIEETSASMRRLNIDNRLWTQTLKETKERIEDINPRFAQFDRNVNSFADSMGRAFGRGARNNFVNAVGSLVRAVFRLPVAFSSLTKLLMSPGGPSKLLTRVSMAATGAFVAIGPLISGIAMLGGAVVALGSSVLMGAIGGLGALGGAGLVAAGGIATLTLAFQNATPEAKRAGRSVKDMIKDLGGTASETVFTNVTEQASRFNRVLDDLRPIVQGVGLEIADLGDHWLDALESPAYDKFRDTMEKFLPDAVGSLGRSLGNVLGGMGGVFRGLVPITERFLGWLEDITGEFAKWANSKEGVRDIKSFMRDAGDSAARLGDLMGAVVDFFGELMDVGNESGDSLLKSMTDTIQGWADKIANNPRPLRKWFNDAADFARVVGRVITKIVELGATLDTEFSRAAITSVFGALEKSIGAVATVLRPLARLFNRSGEGVQNMIEAMGAAALLYGTLGRRAGSAATAIGLLPEKADKTKSRLGKLAGAAKVAGGVAGLGLLIDSSNRASDNMTFLQGAAGGALIGLSAGPWGAALGAIAGGLGAVGMNADDAGSGIRTFEFDGRKLVDTFDAISGAATRATRALIGQRLQRSQPMLLKAGEAIGLTMRDMIGAVQGNEGAIKRVNDALDRGGRKWVTYANGGKAGVDSIIENALPRLQRSFRNTADDQNALIQGSKTWKQALKGLPPQVKTLVKAEGANISADQVATLAATYDLTPKEVQTIINATGVNVTAAQVRNLNRDFKALPPKVETRLDALNWDVTAGQIATLREQYDLTPKEVRTIIKAAGLVNVGRDMQDVMDDVRRLDNAKATPKVDLNKKEVDAGLRFVFGDLLRLDKKKPKPTVELNRNPFNTGLNGVNNDIKDLDSKKPKPKADLDKTPFINVFNAVMNNMGQLDGKKGTAKGDLDPAAFNNVYQNLLGDLNNFDGKTATANAKVNVSGGTELANLQDRLDGLMDRTITVTTEFVSTGSGRLPRTATGGVFAGAQPRLIGEAGPEAVVPLNRPLNQVDPAVRLLSAFAQGKLEGMASGGVVGAGKTYNNEFHIYAASADPRAIAAETINRMATTGYS